MWLRACTQGIAALQELTRERVPLDWAQTQVNVGDALWTLGERESDAARLKQAVAAWDACLTVTASVWPSEWVNAVRSRRDKAQTDIARRLATTPEHSEQDTNI